MMFQLLTALPMTGNCHQSIKFQFACGDCFQRIWWMVDVRVLYSILEFSSSPNNASMSIYCSIEIESLRLIKITMLDGHVSDRRRYIWQILWPNKLMMYPNRPINWWFRSKKKSSSIWNSSGEYLYWSRTEVNWRREQIPYKRMLHRIEIEQ